MTEPLDKTNPPPNGEPETVNLDPLGIMGWTIGGKFQVRTYIGAGGFGEIYEGFNVNLVEQRVILKFFKRTQIKEWEGKEARLLCKLDHPNICRVIDFLPAEGALVIQFINGKDLGDILKESGALAERTLLEVARSITDAIAYAHEQNIAHRDIKPNNIIVDNNGHVYLIDFGIGKEVGGTATRTGYHPMTPMFAAPERHIDGREYNPFLSDVYELGVTLFSFATNSMPYRNPISPNPAEWGGSLANKLSPEFRRILRKATQPRAEMRYLTAREMAEDIRGLNRIYARKSRWPLYAAAVAIVVAGGAYLMRDTLVDYATALMPVSTVTTELEAAPADPPNTETTKEVPTVASETIEATKTPSTSPDKAAISPAPATGNADQSQERTGKALPPPEPPVQTLTTLRIGVEPHDVEALLVDDQPVDPATPVAIEAGQHSIRIIHRHFPVVAREVTTSEGSNDVAYDLDQIFEFSNLVDLQLGLFPPTDDHQLRLILNGVPHTYSQFPVLDLALLEGEWQLEAVVSAVGSGATKVTVDSCISHPFGGGPRTRLIGSRGPIALGAGRGSDAIPFLVYWSED